MAGILIDICILTIVNHIFADPIMSQESAFAKIINETIKDPIKIEILPIGAVQGYVLQLLINNYGLVEGIAQKVVEKHLGEFLLTMKDHLYVVIDSPYVDKLYRDAYYNYYSSKLNKYYRDCIRLSFFNKEVFPVEFKPFEQDVEARKDSISEAYLGFLVLRPTFPKIIGRNAVSPNAFKKDQVICCQTSIAATVNGIKQKVLAFPHASQDNQTMTCSETTVWSVLEYFGNKYPEYRPITLSTINKTLQRFSYKRQLPSEGLSAEQITYAIREFGFGAMIYSKESMAPGVNFDATISTYVESGIPVIAVLQSDEIGHAVNIIGHEKQSVQEIITAKPHYVIDGRISVIDYHLVPRKYVFIDDNHPPYQLASLEYPCRDYYIGEQRWQDCKITHIIAPLYRKIYLDATVANKNVYNALKHSVIGLKDDEPRVLKSFLASSRTYKQYIALNVEMNPLVKEMILAIPMPKFVWIAEVAKIASFEEGLCDELYIQDATEPFVDSKTLNSLSFLASYTGGTFFFQNFGNFEKVTTFANPFLAFKENLN
jgi:hypothetical protein